MKIQKILQAVIKASPLAIIALDTEGRVRVWSESAENLFGWRGAEVLGQILPTIPENRIAEFRTLRRQVLAGEVLTAYETQRLTKAGLLFDVSICSAPVQDEGGRIVGTMYALQDISARKLAEKKLREKEDRLVYLAQHDPLTGIPNRMLYHDRLEQAMARARRAKGQVALMLIDLDRFKNVNDSLGHNVGDQLLRTIARRLQECVRQSDTLARIGGDEFVVILDQTCDLNGIGQVLSVAEKILKIFAQPVAIKEHLFSVTASIGISLYPADALDAEGLMKTADLAMYRAKDQGRNNYQFYQHDANARVHDFLLMESGLRQAVERNELVLYYQPQIDLVSGGVVGAEALLRWRHPERGMISPDDFIPLAEESGLIIPIGAWVLKTACRQARAWQDQGHPPLRISVNISARQFRAPGLVRTVVQALEEGGLEAQYLGLEITESMIMGDVEGAIRKMEEFKALGVHMSIDDFGTGYSSLSALKDFPIQHLKIDRSFVNDVPGDPNGAAIVAAIIGLARNLKLGVIAEGVENMEQLQFLRSQGCLLIQGFLFGRPCPAEDVSWLSGERLFSALPPDTEA